MPSRWWDAQHLALDVTVDPSAATVEGRATHTLKPLAIPRSRAKFHAESLDIRGVSVNGTPTANWRVSRGMLEVAVGSGHSEVVVAIDYAAEPQTGLHFRGRKGPDQLGFWTQGENTDNRHWFPGWDYPNDKFTVDTTITGPEGMEFFGIGDHVETTSANGETTSRFSMKRPVVNYLVAITGSRYRSSAFEEAGLEWMTSVPYNWTDEDAKLGNEVLRGQGPYFEKLFGHPYPYGIYRQVFVDDFLYGAMENPTLTTVASHYRTTGNQEKPEALVEVSAHELVHHWFGDLITCYGFRDLWLNEGFAEYFAWRWMEQVYGEDTFDDAVMSWHASSFGGASRPMAARGWSKVGNAKYQSVYARGASVLRALEVAYGREVFDAGIRKYVAAHADGLVESADLRRTFEDHTGEHLGWLFDQYVHGTGVSTIATSWKHTDGVLTISLKQTDEKTQISGPVQVLVGKADGTVERRGQLSESVQFQVELEEPPLWVSVDPRGGVIARFKHKQPQEAWLALAASSAPPYARMTALDNLHETTATDNAVDTVRELLADRAQPMQVRVHAAKALGHFSTVNATGELEAALDDDSHLVAFAAAEALGTADEPESAKPALRRVALSRTHNQRVAGQALLALAGLDEEAALPVARQVISRKDSGPRGSRDRAAITVFKDHGTYAKDGPFLLRAMDSENAWAANHAALALHELWKEEEIGEKHPLRSKMLTTLHNDLLADEQRIRGFAVRLLGKAGSEVSAVKLEAFASSSTISSLADAARAGASLIRKRGADEPDEANAEAIAELEAKLTALERRLEQLEAWR